MLLELAFPFFQRLGFMVSSLVRSEFHGVSKIPKYDNEIQRVLKSGASSPVSDSAIVFLEFGLRDGIK
jgi:hypothetical protein